MGYYLFHDSGYDPRAVLVKADNAYEAKGKVYEEASKGLRPEFQGEIGELIKSSDDSDVLKVNRL